MGAGAGTAVAMCTIVLCNIIETGRRTNVHRAPLTGHRSPGSIETCYPIV